MIAYTQTREQHRELICPLRPQTLTFAATGKLLHQTFGRYFAMRTKRAALFNFRFERIRKVRYKQTDTNRASVVICILQDYWAYLRQMRSMACGQQQQERNCFVCRCETRARRKSWSEIESRHKTTTTSKVRQFIQQQQQQLSCLWSKAKPKQ